MGSRKCPKSRGKPTNFEIKMSKFEPQVFLISMCLKVVFTSICNSSKITASLAQLVWSIEARKHESNFKAAAKKRGNRGNKEQLPNKLSSSIVADSAIKGRGVWARPGNNLNERSAL